MNDSIPQPPMSDGREPGPGQPLGAGFFAWLRGLGLERSRERWLAGVAGGIAARANIDPIIVRGVFVVLAVLGGPGILLYLAGWLLLPDTTGKIHLEEVVRGRAGTAAIVGVVAVGVIVVLPIMLGLASPSRWGTWGVWGTDWLPGWMSVTFQVLVWIAVCVGIALLIARFALNHGRKVRSEHTERDNEAHATGVPTGGAPGAAPSDTTGRPSGWGAPDGAAGRSFTEQATAWSAQASEQATTWSASVGQRADEWSARYAEHHDARRLGAAHTVLSLAFAFLAAGGAALVAFDLTLAPTTIVLSALIAAVAVLAVSLIIAGVRGRHTGWVGFLAFCGVVALVCMTMLPWGSRFQPFGTVAVGTEVPGSVLIAGTSQVDLTSLDRGEAPHDLVVWQLAGNTTVEVPSRAPLTVTIRVLAGNVSHTSDAHPHANISGPFLSSTVHYPGDGSLPGSRVTVYLLAGNVQVRDDQVPVRNGTDERSTFSPDSHRLEVAR